MNILVTGGASGLGQAITERLAQDTGCKIIFTYNTSVDCAEAIERKWPNTKSCKCDFTIENDITMLSQLMFDQDVDVLIHNAYAGSPFKTHFHKISENEFLEEFQQNVLPIITLTKSALKLFRKKKQGRIITVLTSALINSPPAGSAVYAATKAYLHSLVKTWATENVRFNITSNAVSPEFMLTTMGKKLDERVVEQMLTNHPIKEFLEVDEVAQTVEFLVQAPKHINGVNIALNSGINM